MSNTSKISAREKLQLKKIRLQEEADMYASNIDRHIDYLQENFGSMVVNTAFSSVKNRLPNSFQRFFSATPSQESSIPVKKEEEESSVLSMIADQVLDILPVILKGTKPIILAFLLKQANKIFFKKKKR